MACGCDPRGPGASVLLSVSIKWPKSISECGGEASSSGTEWLRHLSTIDANQRTELQRPWSLGRPQGARSFEQCGSCDQGNQVKKKSQALNVTSSGSPLVKRGQRRSQTLFLVRCPLSASPRLVSVLWLSGLRWHKRSEQKWNG